MNFLKCVKMCDCRKQYMRDFALEIGNGTGDP